MVNRIFVKAAEIEERNRKLRKRRWYHQQKVLSSAYVLVLCCVVTLFCVAVLCLFVCLDGYVYSSCLCVCVFVSFVWLSVCYGCFAPFVYVLYRCLLLRVICLLVFVILCFLLKLRNSRNSIESCGNGDGTINKRCWIPLLLLSCFVVLFC